jgi:hypothetical protein
MKKILVIALDAVLTMGALTEKATAQGFELGARVGIGSQNMNLPDNALEAKARLGWNLAAVSRIRIVGAGSGLTGVGLFFQPEVVYSQNNVKANVQASLPGSDEVMNTSAKIRMQTVDVPLLLSLKASIVRVQAGPVFNLMNNFSSGELEFLPLRPAVGYALGASVDLLGLTIDGRYHGDFKKMSFDGDWADVKSRFSSWSLGVGIMF